MNRLLAAATLVALTLASPALAAPAFAAPAFAAEPDDAAPSVRVSLAGVHFERQAEVAALYSRMKLAARSVCRDAGAYGLDAVAARRACERGALNRAVAQIDQPTLLAMHNGGAMQLADRR